MNDILLITVDSLRRDHLSCYGYKRQTTPNIDEIAEAGSLIPNAFSLGNATRSSFPAIMTSTFPMMYGGYEKISENQDLLSEQFQKEGYRTAGFHSNPYLSSDFGYSRGFDHYHDWRDDPSITAQVRQYVKNNFNNDGRIFSALVKLFNLTEKASGIEVGSLYTNARDITDHAIEWLESEPSEYRFLWVHYMDVHHPYVPPKKYQRKFRDSIIGERTAKRLRRKMLEEPSKLNNLEREKLIDLYDAEIAFVDNEVSRLINHSNNPTIIFTSDHGEEFGEHGRYSHHETFFDENISIPMITNAALNINTGGGLVTTLDIGPTLLESADITQPNTFCGRSLLNQSRSHIDSRDHIMTSVDGKSMYRSKHWKFIEDPNSEIRLFDLDDDPQELNDVSNLNPNIVSKCRDSLDELKERIKRTTTTSQERDLDEETVNRLKQLGYKE